MAESMLFQLVPMLAMVILVIIAAVYMVGKALRVPKPGIFGIAVNPIADMLSGSTAASRLEAYANIELYNLVTAIMFLGVWGAALVGIQGLSHALLPNNPFGTNDPLEVSKLFLNTVINKGVLPMYKDLLTIESVTALSNSFMIRVGPSVWSFVTKVEPGGDAILAMARLMSFGLLTIYGSLSVQYIGLSLLEAFMPDMMALGVLLYMFPPTHEAGCFLMGLSFAFYIVFPFTYALNYIVLNDISWAENNHAYDAYIPEIAGQNVRGLSSVLSLLASTASIFNFEFLIPFINAMAHLSLIALFLPALSMMLTMSTASSITKVLSGKAT